MLSQNSIDTKPFIMIINPGAYHYETVCSPNNEYIFNYELIKINMKICLNCNL